MNLPITHLTIVCLVISSDGRENGKEWASYHLYHLYLIKSFGCFLSLTFGFLLLLLWVFCLFVFLINMKTLALVSLNISTWHFVLSFFLISQYAQNFIMSKHKQTAKQNKTTVQRKVLTQSLPEDQRVKLATSQPWRSVQIDRE